MLIIFPARIKGNKTHRTPVNIVKLLPCLHFFRRSSKPAAVQMIYLKHSGCMMRRFNDLIPTSLFHREWSAVEINSDLASFESGDQHSSKCIKFRDKSPVAVFSSSAAHTSGER
jgi:hypothetical protein